MPQEYKEAYARFIEYIEKKLAELSSHADNFSSLKETNDMYEALKTYDVDKFILYADKIVGIDEDLANDVELIKFFKEEGVTLAEQMSASMNNILNNDKLLELVNEYKEYSDTDYSKMIEKLNSVLSDSTYSEAFKEVLLQSDLSDEDILTILRGKAFESIIVPTKENKFTEVKEEQQENPEHIEILNKVEAIIQKYYYLVQEKKSVDDKLYKSYEKFLTFKSIEKDDKAHLVDDIKDFADKEVSLALLVTYLISKKQLINDIDDAELKELYFEELEEVYNATLEVSKLYDQSKLEELPLDASVYYLLEDGRPLFDLEELSEEDKEKLKELHHELELGKFDYVGGKTPHAKVQQSIRKDLNVFVNRKSSSKISYVRITDEKLQDSKVLVLTFDNGKGKNIYESSQYILKKKSDLLDHSLECVKSQDEAFLNEQNAFWNDEVLSSSRKEV